MSRFWTKRETAEGSGPPRGGGPRVAPGVRAGAVRAGAAGVGVLAAGIAFLAGLGALATLGCGKNKTTDLIKPVTASATIAPVSATPPYIYITNPISTGDLVTVEVRLNIGASPITFDAYTLEFAYDPGLVQPELVEDTGPVTPFPTASASSGAVCNDVGAVCSKGTFQSPICLTAFSGGTFLFGASVDTGDGCPVATAASGDIHLLTLGLQAETTGTSLIQIGPPGKDSCAILDNLSPAAGVGCYGTVTLTASR